MRILRAENYRRMPWKNGGGETTEIAVFPAGAGLDDFDWRVSMARVESSGPFSVFPGIDRTLAILEGEGLLLEIAGLPLAEMTGASRPLSFPADAPTTASLLAGPITDLNVMTRRGRTAHKVTRHEVAGSMEVPLEADETLILCSYGPIHVTAVGEHTSLRQFDTVIFGHSATTIRIEAVGHARFFLIEFDKLS